MKKFCAFAATVLLLMTAAGCRMFSNNRPEARKIAAGVEIGTNWKDIVPEQPLQTNEEIQFVGLKLENIKKRSENDPQKLIREDGGGEFQIDVELIDVKGEGVRLFPIGIGQFVEFGTGDRLPKNGLYKTIRIRSSADILVKEIIWGDSSAW